MISNASGDTVAGYYQEGFGNIKQTVGSADNNHHLTTKELDPDTGLYYFYARWYDSEVGRFIGKDKKWHLNLYLYVDNNPVLLVDPNGLSSAIVNSPGAGCSSGSGSGSNGGMCGCCPKGQHREINYLLYVGCLGFANMLPDAAGILACSSCILGLAGAPESGGLTLPLIVTCPACVATMIIAVGSAIECFCLSTYCTY